MKLKTLEWLEPLNHLNIYHIVHNSPNDVCLFQDRKQDGGELAIILKEHLIHSNGDFNKWNSTKLKDSLIVLAIPRGGVVLGDIIASKLRCNLDIIVSKKIGAPTDKEFAIGAVMSDGSFFFK